MLGDVLEAAARHRGSRAPRDRTTRPPRSLAEALGVEVIADPGRRPGGRGRGGARRVAGMCLVVNADLPLRHACGAAPPRGRRRSRSWPRRTARRTRSPCPSPSCSHPLYGPGSAARFRAHAGHRHRRRSAELEYDVDTVADLEASPLRAGRRRTLCRINTKSRWPRERERRSPLGRRRRREARRRPPRRARARRADDRSATSATTSRCSASTSRPISTPCSTASPA